MGSIGHTRATSTGVTIGTNVFYGPFHQLGTRKMIARPFLGIGDKDMVEIKQAVDAWVDNTF